MSLPNAKLGWAFLKKRFLGFKCWTKRALDQFCSSSLNIVEYLLTNHFEQGPKFEDWKKTYNCWGMSLSNKLDLRLNLNNDDRLSPISMLPSFHRTYFLQDQDLAFVCNATRKKGTALQDDFFSNDNHCSDHKNCIELGSFPGMLFATSNKFKDCKFSQWGGSSPDK